MKEFYRYEWKVAEKEGNIKYAKCCKERYRLLVTERLITPYTQGIYALRAYPTIYLN